MLRVSLLGGFTVTADGYALPLSVGCQRLVALAALQPGRLTRAAFAARLWPHLDPRGAAGSLRSTLSRVRRAHPLLLAAHPTQVALAEHVILDVREVEEAAHRLAAHHPLMPVADDELVHGIATELLPEWDDEWAAFERDRLRELALHALCEYAGRLIEAGHCTRAVDALYTVLRADPLRESALRRLIELHLAEGDQVQAVRTYLQFRSRLVAALGVEPSAETRALVMPLVAGRGRM